MSKHELSLVEVTHYTDAEVLDTVKDFHARGNFASLPELTERTFVSAVPLPHLDKFENKEVLFRPGFSSVIRISPSNNFSRERCPSGINFCDKNKLYVRTIEKLLVNAFSSPDPTSVRRPYPSGGAQYPIEVFLCRLSENTENWQAGTNVYHYLPLSQALEPVVGCNTQSLYRSLSGGDSKRLGRPYFALVYCVIFEKALFKYRYRGYRMALMEAGSMYQSAGLVADQIGLRNRVWAGFTDSYVAKTMNLDLRTVAPLIIQFFGDVNDDKCLQ
ncbi:SagB/ThcOx family dehydrogenase [Salmonella enterica]|nr:SagB/ThcOx family dehydrogenase [Salmonella enterica subsp. enterica]ECZ7213181.1 SagB/ThcOx family dehydrogenase [Salmonella enterica]EDT6561736.1 SagB/ThcOx family dehydrogenase [Salmonella enterica subsp. enterica]EDV0395450.1 SagB/ThcOx family dehydrogenase [Salmonella enterica subsp. enterica]EHP1945069.1 SagB/ThcOx family dehydrogenase [Salmonella enterica]